MSSSSGRAITLSIVAFRNASASCSNAWTTQVFFDAFRQSLVDELVDFAVNAFARDEDLFEERELFVILVDFEFYQTTDLFPCCLARGDLGEVMDDRRHLLIDAVFDERDRFGRESFCERGFAVREVVQTSRNKLVHFRFEPFGRR